MSGIVPAKKRTNSQILFHFMPKFKNKINIFEQLFIKYEENIIYWGRLPAGRFPDRIGPGFPGILPG
jgi:hypothetical protein